MNEPRQYKNDLQEVASGISGYGPYDNTGAKDDFYYDLSALDIEAQIEHVVFYGIGVYGIILNREEALKVIGFLNRQFTNSNDTFWAFDELSK